jgi:hypothetical protein
MSIVKCHKERLYPAQDPVCIQRKNVCIHWTFGPGVLCPSLKYAKHHSKIHKKVMDGENVAVTSPTVTATQTNQPKQNQHRQTNPNKTNTDKPTQTKPTLNNTNKPKQNQH